MAIEQQQAVRHQLLALLEGLDWTNLEEVSSVSEAFLRELAGDRNALQAFLVGLQEDPALLAMCEHYDLLDKLVLARGQQTDFRLRLHLFLPGYFDRPHNHRWTYSSLILHGSYQHSIFGQDDQLSEDIDVSSLRPIMVHRQHAGDFYTLHHSLIHSVVSEPFTVSLILRGPSTKERFLVMDRVENRAWWQYGMASESTEQRTQKVMSREHLRGVLASLADLGIT
jgi:hypothetical protein